MAPCDSYKSLCFLFFAYGVLQTEATSTKNVSDETLLKPSGINSLSLGKPSTLHTPIVTSVSPKKINTGSTGIVIPSSTHVSPNTASVSPGSTHVSPNTASVSPGSTHVSPNTASVSPGSTHVSPNTASVSPNATHAHSNATTTNPNATLVHPNSTSINQNGSMTITNRTATHMSTNTGTTSSHHSIVPTPSKAPGKGDDKDYNSMKKRMWVAATFAIIFAITTVILGYLVYRQRKINRELEGDPSTSRLL